ncbi:unnamed protein product [Dicrocoelium dendriticum]|nr:unnamed protein product [Dicrocoelium dendriticum]
MTMITLSTFLATTVVNLFYRGADGHPPPLWARHLIIDWLGRIACLRGNIPLPTRCPRPALESALSPSVNDADGKAMPYDVVCNEAMLHQQMNATPSWQNGLFPTANGFASMQMTTENPNIGMNQEAKQIRCDVCMLDQLKTFSDIKEYAAMEWRTLSLVVDRMFFILYVITMVITLAAVVWNTEVTDMGQLFTRSNAIAHSKQHA